MGSPIVVMGVSGSGKSTVGAALGQRLRVPFADADDFHPKANIEKMSSGQALNDDDRHPWLDAIGEWLGGHCGDGGVMSCSALKRKYRDRLRSATPGLGFVFLQLTPQVAADRVAHRPGHFMPSTLIDSQFATLESPVGEPLTLALDATIHSVDRLAEQAHGWWLEHGLDSPR